MELERLIKRSRVIEGRLAGNIFGTIAIGSDGKTKGVGENPSLSKRCVALFSDQRSFFAITNNFNIKCHAVSPYMTNDVVNMPYAAFLSDGICSENIKKVDSNLNIIVALYLDGNVSVYGDCKNGEVAASGWTNMDDVFIVDGGVIGVTKEGEILLCGKGAQQYTEMTKWNNIARIKKIVAGPVRGLSYSGFIGLKKDGTLVYCGEDNDFKAQISDCENVVSFDAWTNGGYVQQFYFVSGDGSIGCFSRDNEALNNCEGIHHTHGNNFVAVKYLPSGPHFIKYDGTVVAIPQAQILSNLAKDIVKGLCGEYYFTADYAINHAEKNPLANDVKDWKIFDDPDEVLRCYEGFEDGSFARNKKCRYCGGDLKGFLFKKCVNCGKN